MVIYMEKILFEHMHEDIEALKNDVAVIKHILSEEGELNEEAKLRLQKSRNTAESKYTNL